MVRIKAGKPRKGILQLTWTPHTRRCVHPKLPATATAGGTLVHGQDGPAAAKLVIACPVVHLAKAQQRQCCCTHDAGLNRHKQLAAAGREVSHAGTDRGRGTAHRYQARRGGSKLRYRDLLVADALQPQTQITVRSLLFGTFQVLQLLPRWSSPAPETCIQALPHPQLQ